MGPDEEMLPDSTRLVGISIHGARVGPDLIIADDAYGVTISIHGARVGPDQQLQRQREPGGISIHGARVGPDPNPPVAADAVVDFNPRGPCGPRLALRDNVIVQIFISIHGARVGPDW